MGSGASAQGAAIEPSVSAQPGVQDTWQRPETWPARKEVPALGPNAPHVVLSTKYKEPWGSISRGLKEILEEKGCSVYNPNTDNAAIYGDEAAANDAWLDTFTQNLEQVKRTKGFVLQIQQGVVRQKTKMQEAEERIAGPGWLDVPRIGVYSFPSTHFRGGSFLAEKYMEDAIAAARSQWAKGICKEVQMVSEVFEALDGELHFEGNLVHGLARCTWPSGSIYEGDYRKGRRHGVGRFTWASGEVYDGDFQEDMMHGMGRYKLVNGDLEVSLYEEDLPKGSGIRLERACLFRDAYWLLKDGQKDRKLSRAEAQRMVKDLGLPQLQP